MSPALERMTDEQFRTHALGVLERELGLDGFARFLRLYRSGAGDYTRDRQQWLGKRTVEEIVAHANKRAA